MDFSATSGAQWKINLALKMVLPFCPQLLDGNLPTSGISCLIRASLFTWGSWVTPHVCCCCCCCLVDQSCHTLCDPMDCSPPGASVHEISQARIPGQGATSFCRGPSRPRDWTRNSCVSCTGVSSLPSAPPGRPWCHSVCPRTRRAAGALGRLGEVQTRTSHAGGQPYPHDQGRRKAGQRLGWASAAAILHLYCHASLLGEGRTARMTRLRRTTGSSAVLSSCSCPAWLSLWLTLTYCFSL